VARRPGRSQPPKSGDPFARRLVLIGLVALAVRIVYLLELRGESLVAVPIGDGWQYDAWAQTIVRGEAQDRAFYQTPLYPYLLAAIYSVFGHDLWIVRGLQAVFGAASCVLLGLAGRTFFNERIGLAAALLLAVYPWAIFADGLIQKSSLDALLVTSTLACLGTFATTERSRWIVAAGLAAGAFALNRETGRVLYPVVIAWLLLGWRGVMPVRTRIAWSAAFLGAVAAVHLPVAIHNFKASGAVFLTTTQLGPNFYIGNHSGASGIYEPLASGGGSAERERDDAVRLAEAAAGRPLSPAEVSRFWLQRSFDDIRNEPGAWLRLTGRKLLLTLNAAEIADTESIEVYREHSSLLALLAWIDVGLVLPLAVFGFWQRRWDWRRLALVSAMLAVLLLSVAAFFVLARYRFPAVPVLLMFAAAGLVSLAELRRGSVRHALPGLVLAVAVAMVARLPLASAYRDTTEFNVGIAYVKSGQPREAIPWLERALQRDQTDASAHFALGVARSTLGEVEPAVDALRNAVRLRPDDVDARKALAGALNNSGSASSERGDLAKAIAAFQESLALRPGDPPTLNNLALAQYAGGRAAEAIRALREAVLRDPKYAEAHANLALMLEGTGAIAEARTHLATARRLQPEHAGIQAAYAAFVVRHGEG
jgi:tetratricopeptide (TPR) repeat protein